MRITIGAHRDKQLTGPNIDPGSFRMPCRPGAQGTNAEQTPNRDHRPKEASSHICTQAQTHAFRRALVAPMSARAVAITRPVLTMITRIAFLDILSGPRPVAPLSGVSIGAARTNGPAKSSHWRVTLELHSGGQFLFPKFRPHCCPVP